ncbi:FERM, RhoGEF and pleckstrin domain-containing protein 1 isoform X2 [Zootermopsis nevadensis]|uniref:FERM, RhoGEF and pleckstrin domain-containing protein 1 isoform X2 n=1 Tax=Zootermopsis nevadensis TaxID=136037 RepID=UPI000B8E7E6F|nr:FERM, RhoGEF and pleckstrin domain-containing protein 1 isoform X2 [Zootermopsis nevadensis]
MDPDGGVGGISSMKLPHSHSTPAGVDGGTRTPPTTPKKGGKMLAVRVQMLDDSVTMFQVQAKALGRVLFDQVCKQLHLLEADYFGLEYQEVGGTKYWLDLEKPLSRQVGLSLVDTLLKFCVKFYTPDPAQLEEEFTRYLFCLQIKRDLAQGLLQCNDNTAALMASYIVQAECGDYVVEDYPDHTYLSTYKFVPNQDHELERRIMENHKKHAGQSPAEADLNLLETSRRCELYGMKMHPAKDHEGVPLNLAVAHMGIVVFQNFTKINTFSWAKIRKISFKRKRFLVKLHPEGYGYYKDTVEFFFEGRNECKNFWKKCVENHGFFRCSAIKHVPRQKTRVLSRGSSFRYSGKTQKQIVEFVRENYVKRQTFQRSQSFRHSSSAHSSVANVVGTSLSAHPLLPLGDNAVVGTPASLSCGSMTLGSTMEHQRGVGSHHHHHRHSNRDQAGNVSPLLSPTHTVDIHDFDTRDLTIMAAGGVGTTSPSPPLTTSLSPGTSITSSPQHFYPGGRQTDDEEQEYTTGVTEQRGMLSTGGSQHQSPYRHQNTGIDTVEGISGTPQLKMQDNSTCLITSTPNENGSIATNHKVENEIHMPDVSPLKIVRDELPVAKIASTIEGEVDMRRKRYPTDRAYFIAKEILMTERTYKKDLEVISLWFRDEVSKEEGEMPHSALMPLFSLIEPLLEYHCGFLRDVETRLATWEGRSNAHLNGDYRRIGDVLLKNMGVLSLYEKYLAKHLVVLEKLDSAFRLNHKFEQLYRDFEMQKVCYLPLTAFILKPLQRLLHYENLLDRLLKHYGKDHQDYEDCLAVKNKLIETSCNVPSVLQRSENFVALCELQRDLNGFDNLVQPDREFVRQGCLLKHSRKGFQQRMFFLFSDLLLYTNRIVQPSPQFKVHGQLPLRGVIVEETPDNKTGANYCFSIYGGNRALTVAASSQEEKDKWLEDLTATIQTAREKGDNKLQYLSLKSCSSSDEVMETCGGDGVNDTNGTGREKAAGAAQRSNTTVHVCWHRNTSISMRDQLRAVENQLSGYLLRKFKNSNGWQKLWVVFTNFCLFFYKTFQDDFPLASLPLLGYTVSSPSEQDAIHKEYVFKLQFKNHVYFFRAESEYTFGRWMEVISSATQHSGRLRLFSRKESVLEDS